jgi:2-iminobutanoate/2-iminopropanoate deaminase
MDPSTRRIVEGEFEVHVRQCMANVESILKAAGTDLDHVLKVVVFLKDMDNFARLNAVYNTFWPGDKPARSCVQVARLPLDVDVEIEAIATLP